MKYILTTAILLALATTAVASNKDLLKALDQLEQAQARLEKAEAADNAKLLLQPEISLEFRAAAKDAKAVAKKANELAAPERAVNSVLGIIGQIAGIGGPVGLLTAGGMFGVGRMRRRSKLHQFVRDQGVDPHDPKLRGVDEFEMIRQVQAKAAANGNGKTSGRQKATAGASGDGYSLPTN